MHVMPSSSNDDVIPDPSDNTLSSTTLHSLVNGSKGGVDK